jgi:hypothetical protein
MPTIILHQPAAVGATEAGVGVVGIWRWCIQPVVVCFRVHRAVSFGQHVALVGKSTASSMFSWNIEDAVPMQWEEGDLWAVELDMHTWEMVRPPVASLAVTTSRPSPMLTSSPRWLTPVPPIRTLPCSVTHLRSLTLTPAWTFFLTRVGIFSTPLAAGVQIHRAVRV